MKKYIIGFIIGLVLGGGIGFAASSYITLQDQNGNVINAGNPLPIANN